MCECEGGVPGSPPQQLPPPADAPPPPPAPAPPKGGAWAAGLRGGGRLQLALLPPAVVGPAARCRLPLARPSSAKLHLPRGLRQSWWAARNLDKRGGQTTEQGKGQEAERAEGRVNHEATETSRGGTSSSLTGTPCGSTKQPPPLRMRCRPKATTSQSTHGSLSHLADPHSPAPCPLPSVPILFPPPPPHLRMSDWLSTASLSPPEPSGSATTILWLAAGWRLWPPDHPGACGDCECVGVCCWW